MPSKTTSIQDAADRTGGVNRESIRYNLHKN